MKLAALILAATTAASPAAAPGSPLGEKVDRYLKAVVDARDFNGVVLVARGDEVLVRKAIGQADWDLEAPLSAESRFRVASITKTFTGAAVVMLAERGKLSYDDPLSKFILGYPSGDRIKIRHLLLHSSGVPNPSFPTCSSATLDDVIAELAGKPLDFEPGSGGRYSNGGYALLARVIEKVSGKTWQAFLHDEIFVPAKLAATSVDEPGKVVPGRARGFIPGPGTARVEHAQCEGTWAAIGSGAIVSSAGDLHRWGRSVRGEALFKRSALEHPYGWGVRKYYEKAVIEQSGIVNGFSSYLAVYLDEDLYIVVLSNLQTGMLTDIGKGLAALALGLEAPTLAASPDSVPWTPDERRKWLGRFKNDDIATVELSERDGGVYLRWADSPTTVFLASTGPGKAYNRQDAIAMELAPDGSALLMRWGTGDPQRFARLP